MTARDDELRELAAAWALGSLSPEEAREFEALMARSPEVQSEADSYREVAAMLPLGAGVLAPDPGLKARVLARATGRAKRAPQSGRRKGDRYLRLALAACTPGDSSLPDKAVALAPVGWVAAESERRRATANGPYFRVCRVDC